MRNAARTLVMLLGLVAFAGCSRTTDGTIVPSYQMTVDEYAGIPYLALRRTPLEGPDPLMPEMPDQAAGFPPAPLPPRPTAEALAEARPPRQAKPRRSAPQPASELLACRGAEPDGRAVRIVCE